MHLALYTASEAFYTVAYLLLPHYPPRDSPCSSNFSHPDPEPLAMSSHKILQNNLDQLLLALVHYKVTYSP